MIKTSSTALSPQCWPFALDWLPSSAYLVGGCVRDALQDRTSAYLDLDFVLPERPVEVAQAIAQHYRAGFVQLDAQRQIARVVFPEATADFALQVGDSLTTDLHRRDFTVNAIAYHPHTQTLVDPLDGQGDLQRGLMRMIAPQNLREDPLRLVRAYRQACQLGFALEGETQVTIRALVPRLQQIAVERIRVELGYLLSHAQGPLWLEQLRQDGLLGLWFPDATPAALARMAQVDRILADGEQAWSRWGEVLDRPLNERAKGSEAMQRTLRNAVKLTASLHETPAIAKRTLTTLKYARTEITVAITLLQEWLTWQQHYRDGGLPRHQQYFMYRRLGDMFPAFALWLRVMGVASTTVMPLIAEYLQPDSPIAHPQVLITGKALMAHLHLQPGPPVGQLLQQLEQAQAEGHIETTADAIALAKTWL